MKRHLTLADHGIDCCAPMICVIRYAVYFESIRPSWEAMYAASAS